MSDDYGPLTQSTLNEGKGEREFQNRLREVAQMFESPERYEHAKDGTITIRMTVEYVFTKRDDESAFNLETRSSLTPPKLKSIGRTAYYDRGAFTQKQAVQQDLFSGRPYHLEEDGGTQQ